MSWPIPYQLNLVTKNCVEKHKKLQYCIDIYQNTASVDANVLDNVINTLGSPFH